MHTKLLIKIYLKNITENETNNYNVLAIKNKNKLSYIIDKEKYTLKINMPSSIIIKRETPDIINTLYFENDKITTSTYYIKEKDIYLDIKIKTNKLVFDQNNININYTVTDSNNNYEYNIEMSDQNEYKKYD